MLAVVGFFFGFSAPISGGVGLVVDAAARVGSIAFGFNAVVRSSSGFRKTDVEDRRDGRSS
jgi:hypothetical protein